MLAFTTMAANLKLDASELISWMYIVIGIAWNDVSTNCSSTSSKGLEDLIILKVAEWIPLMSQLYKQIPRSDAITNEVLAVKVCDAS